MAVTPSLKSEAQLAIIEPLVAREKCAFRKIGGSWMFLLVSEISCKESSAVIALIAGRLQ